MKREYASCVACGYRTTGRCIVCGCPIHIFDCSFDGKCEECVERENDAKDVANQRAAERQESEDSMD